VLVLCKFKFEIAGLKVARNKQWWADLKYAKG